MMLSAFWNAIREEPAPLTPTGIDAGLISMIPPGWKLILGQGNPYRADNPGTFWVADLVRVFTNPKDGKLDFQECKGIGDTPTQALRRAAEKVYDR